MIMAVFTVTGMFRGHGLTMCMQRLFCQMILCLVGQVFGLLTRLRVVSMIGTMRMIHNLAL